MKWATINVVLLAIMSVLMRCARGCPAEVCVCKWKGGKQTVECGGGMLENIPEGMDPGTQVLNFTGNNLLMLKSERFYQMDLINLQKIYLCRNKLFRIYDRAFKGLSNLVELDVSDNSLTTVPTETFQDYSSLMRLSLSSNSIRELKTNAFRHLSFLTTLELSNNQIEKIEDDAFRGMDNLEWLRLDGNRIGTIRGGHVLPKSLHGINLHGNRWNCDCNMVDLHKWLVNFNIPQQIEDPKCLYPPRLTGEVIKFLKYDELACLPDITPTTLYLELAEGRNISLQCKIQAIPEATVSWWFQGQLLQNDSFLEPNLHLIYYIEEGAEEKRSELFLFNTHSEYNGTFSCVAENSAGRSLTNYTIRVILKEEPAPEKVLYPYEYFLIIIVGAGASGFLVVLIVCCLILKCIRRSKKSKRRKESSKDSTIQLQNSKCSSIISEAHVPLPILKANGSIVSPQQEMMMFVNQSSSNSGDQMATTNASQYCGGGGAQQTMRNYHEQNPDLINDAESNKNRMQSEGNDDVASSEHGSNGPSSIQGSICENGGYHSIQQQQQQKMLPQLIRDTPPRFNPLATLPRGIIKDLYQHQVDVHLNPGCFLGQDGYPVEYRLHHAGIPIMPHMMQQQNAAAAAAASNQVNYYRTLPHKPKNQLASAVPRYSMEAEFLARTPSFDSYGLRDMRYTAEGYPIQMQQQPQQPPPKQVLFADQQFPSPPEGYKCDISQPLLISTTTASPSCQQQWPPCLPGYHQTSQMVPIKTQQHIMVGGQQLMSPTNSTSSSVISNSNASTTTNSTGGSQQGHAASATTTTASATTAVVTKRCVGAQTHDPRDTIPEQQEDNDDDEEEGESGSDENATCSNNHVKHLIGPLADSPDEGYVGDSQDGSDM